jgi:hypothetical protein
MDTYVCVYSCKGECGSNIYGIPLMAALRTIRDNIIREGLQKLEDGPLSLKGVVI